MENASKALLIAAAILVVLIIMAIGMAVVQQVNNARTNANLDSTQIEAFNSKWEAYRGINKTASEVQSVFSAAIANNASEKKLGTNRFVTVTGLTGLNISGSATALTTTVPNSVSNGSNYSISLTYGDNGLVSTITIGQ